MTSRGGGLAFTADIGADRLHTVAKLEQGRIQQHKRCGKLLPMGGGRGTTASGCRERE